MVACLGTSPNESADEQVLGSWLHRQHQLRSESRLKGWRKDALDSAVLGWRSRS